MDGLFTFYIKFCPDTRCYLKMQLVKGEAYKGARGKAGGVGRGHC